MAGVKAGRTNKLYFNKTAALKAGNTGTYAAPDWELIDRIGDLDRSNSKNSTEVDMRASPTTIVIYGNKSREVSFTYYKREGANDEVFNALLKSYEDDVVMDIALAEADIATTGSVYDRGPFIVAEMTKAEPIAGVDAYDITMNVADATQDDGVTPFLYQPNLVAA